ncbi:MAG: MFS family permease [Cycloclasticus sp.]|jgi:MFS family permease|tara:strand:- start:875 stop:2404 length:1530 start_codon:yes stop_codon:yes gene_type:complete
MLIAMTISNIGTWMNEVGTTWLMASMPTSDLYIALIQTAITLPFLFLAYPSGTLADLVDRRRMLIWVHVLLFLTAVGLAVCAFYDAITPLLLLLFTFGLGAGNAIMRPAWASSVPDFAPREHLPSAITLNTVSTNVTRAIGPAIGGLIIYQAGTTAIFILNAASFTVLIYALYQWKPVRPNNPSTLPVERFMGAFRTGLRYTRNSRSLKVVLLRSAAFFFFASVSWALLPVIVIRDMGMSSQNYGVSMAVVGIGTFLGAFLLPRCHRLLTRDQIIQLSTVLLSLPILLLAYLPNLYSLAFTLVTLGIAWTFCFSSFMLAAQTSVPNWVRARTISLVMLTFGGSMAFGSFLWGHLSDSYGSSLSMAIAAIGLLSTLVLSKRFTLANDSLDLSATTQWPITIPEDSIEADKGPVMVTIQYHIPADKTDEFLDLMEQMRANRQRNGAYFWQIFHDSVDHQLYSEMYMSESWLDVLRQRQRMTASEQAVRERVLAMHQSDQAPVISIQIAGKA